jgi:quercetin dioxygenase-like cupin family protein
MKTHKLSDFNRGWVIGHFENSLLRTTDFEVAVITHYKGEQWAPHVHKVATEYNILLKGSMRMCGIELVAGDIFVVDPNEISDPIFHEDCQIVCVKTPSVPGDKYIV